MIEFDDEGYEWHEVTMPGDPVEKRTFMRGRPLAATVPAVDADGDELYLGVGGIVTYRRPDDTRPAPSNWRRLYHR